MGLGEAMRKSPPFQNIDRMQPRRKKPRQPERIVGVPVDTGPAIHETASEPPAIDHMLGTEGCYRSHKYEDT